MIETPKPEGRSAMRYRAISKLFGLSLVVITVALAAEPIRVSWNSPVPFIDHPVFRTESVQQPGTVIVRVKLRPDGRISEAKVVAGESPLREVVEQSSRTWRFSKSQPADFPVYVYFRHDDGNDKGRTPLPPPPPYGAMIGSLDISGLPKDLHERVARTIGVKPGDVLTEQVMNHLRKAVKDFSPPIRFWVSLGAHAQPIVHIRPR